MIGWEYPPHNSGGLGVACEGMTQALAGMNTNIYFTLPYALGSAPAHMNVLECSDPAWFADGVASATAPPFLAYASALSQQTVFRSGKIDAASLNVLPTSELEAKVDTYAELVVGVGMNHKQELDVIHAHDWMSFPAAIRLSNVIKKPFIAHVHSTELDRIPNGYGSEYIMKTEYEGMAQATRVIAVSYYTKQLLVTKYGINPEKIDIVHNGVKPFNYAPRTDKQLFAPDRPVIVFMGRLTMQKGADYFIALAKTVLQRIPDALFILAGDGDMYHELLFKTADEKLSASVLFSGFVRDAQRAKLLERADVFVMPSLSEPFGLVALEAAQRHTPVIVSTNAGVSEVMPSSIRVDFWDIKKMAEKIAELVGSPVISKELVAAQLRDIEYATWEKSAQKMKEVYARTLLGM